MNLRLLRGMTVGDGVLLALLLMAGGGSVAVVVSGLSPGTTVVVEVNGTVVQKLSLLQPSRTPVRGTRGELVVEVCGGRAAVISAECPNHVCVRMGWRSRAGDVIVCVPNHVVVKILGKRQEGIHAVTG
jgi:hypothetical protein